MGERRSRQGLPGRAPARAFGSDARREPRLPSYPVVRKRSERLRRGVGSAAANNRDEGACTVVRGAAPRGCGLFAQHLPAGGFVSARERSTVVEVDMVGEDHIRGMQSLLARFGIFARVGFKRDARTNRLGCWTLRIQNAGDRRIFADEIGFIDPIKADKLEASFDKPGKGTKAVKRLEIARIEVLGDMEVY